MEKLKGCIFDLDGVICDTAKYHYQAWKRLATELSFTFTLADNERLKGVSRMDSLNILLEIGGIQRSGEEKEELARKKNGWYTELICQMKSSDILPGVLPFFQQLRQQNVAIALGSASKNAGIILEKLEITPYFDAIVDGTAVQHAKPNPEVFFMAAKKLGFKPDECIVFEDAAAGIEAAKRAGMYSVGVGSTQTLGQADQIISGFERLTLEQIGF